jgi:hypothetical protein
VDQELKQLDLAIAEARRLATATLDRLRAPQATLRVAAGEYIGSVATRRVLAMRRASVEVIARLSDEEVAELRYWSEEQVRLSRERVEKAIRDCDFWIPEAQGLSPTDVTVYGNALMPKPNDTKTGIPQALVALFEQALTPLRRGMAAVGLAVIPAAAEPRVEVALARAWRAYREAAIECVARWADVDERYHASAERFQEMRWELAADVDVPALIARREAEESETATRSVVADAQEAAEAAVGEPLPAEEPYGGEAFARSDSETLVPIPDPRANRVMLSSGT